ncbi:MAG: DUF7522 family protein [Halobacteriota archaeon]
MNDPVERLVATFLDFGGDSLRTVWVFDQTTHERLYVREDVSASMGNDRVRKFVDNERYGYITRSTYESLYDCDYSFTVRGFDSFELFRTFIATDAKAVGVFAGFDAIEDGYDFGSLNREIQENTADISPDGFFPAGKLSTV